MSLFHGIATAVLSGREVRRLPQSVPALGQAHISRLLKCALLRC